jgi:hypothetical protein
MEIDFSDKKQNDRVDNIQDKYVVYEVEPSQHNQRREQK